jgi:beta-lactamase class A
MIGTRLSRLSVAGAVALAMCTVPGLAQKSQPLADVLRAKCATDLEAIAQTADGVVGYVVIDVETGERFARLDYLQFPTASTIKLAVLYELLKQSDEGRIALDEVAPMDRTRAVPGGLLNELTNPSLSPRDLAVAMILQSDNTATNVLIDRVGMAAVNRRMSALGLTATQLRRHMIDLAAARRGDENVSTPADLARLVLVFHRGDGLSASSKEAALTILQKFKSTPIRSGVPADVAVASKSGELEGVRADAGIVYVPGRPYVFVAMGTFLRDDAQPSGALEQLARLSYQYFSRRATVSGYGRQIK